MHVDHGRFLRGSEWSATYCRRMSSEAHPECTIHRAMIRAPTGRDRMPQLVFLHGPGAGACADAYHYQLQHFPNSVAPTLPGHLEGTPVSGRCAIHGMGARLAVGAGPEQGPRAGRLHAGRVDSAAIWPRLSGRSEGPRGDDRCGAAQGARAGHVRDAAARRGGPEGLRRVARVSAARDEVRGTRTCASG